jgi:uncharacterized protein YebE (UPF0316 family)
MDFLQSNLYIWIGLPLLVFFARVIDVSLGTLRLIFISRGKKYIAPLLGFVEVFIWIAVVAQIVRGVNDLAAYFAYAAGFAAGNFVGMYIEERLAIGTQVIRIIVPYDADDLTANLSVAGYGVTSVDGQGANGPVKLIYGGQAERFTDCVNCDPPHPPTCISLHRRCAFNPGRHFPRPNKHRICR